MRFESQAYWLAKDAEYPEEYQDAFALDAERGVATVADGVASAVYSGSWARILTRAVVSNPTILEDRDRFHAWLAEHRTAWRGEIDLDNVPWFVKPRICSDGAMTTLLWIQLLPARAQDQSGDGNGYLLRSFAIGDCCLFHLRGREQLRSFPIDNSQAFGLDPKVIRSVDQSQDTLAQFQMREDECLPGDLLVLTSDALAQWAVNCWEAGEPTDWEKFWDMSQDDWCEEILAMRRGKLVRYDDTTLLLLRVVDETDIPKTAGDGDAPSCEL